MDCSPPGSSVCEIIRQEYWSELPFPPPEDFLNTEMKPVSPVSPALAGRLFTTESPGKPLIFSNVQQMLLSKYIKMCYFGRKGEKQPLTVHILNFTFLMLPFHS